MNKITKLLALCAMLIASVSVASATPLTGSIAIGGTDTFTATGINFNPSTGIVLAATDNMAPFRFFTATLQSFSFDNTAIGTTVFSVSNFFNTLYFTISNIVSSSTSSTGDSPTLAVSGTGTFYEVNNKTGANIYTPTSGLFSLTSSTTGITSFQLVSTAVTPEPSSLLLLGTGLVGAAGMLFRRRRLAV